MSYQIPMTQVAAVVPGPKQKVVIWHDFPVVQPSTLQPGECLVKMICSGVCHSDLCLSNAVWPLKAKTPIICGHEGVGVVVAIGEHTEVSPVKLGQRVGIKFMVYNCRDCEQCREGYEQNCQNIQTSALTTNGTFSEYVVSWVHQVTAIPESLDSFEAAPLLCAGVTVYRALKYSEARVGNWAVITGAGGGLGHLAVQYAVVMGMRVIAIDAGAEKKKLCQDLGAEKWIDYEKTTDIVQAVKEACNRLGAHTAIVTSPHSEGYAHAVDYLRPGGTLMAVGLPADATLSAPIFWTVVKNISIKGSCVGNRQDTIEAIEIAASRKVKVMYILRGLTELQQVYTDLEECKVAGRVVLDFSK